MVEFNLSEKIINSIEWYGINNPKNNPIFRLDTKDVKEFIRLLKEEALCKSYCLECETFKKVIDKLAGDKLI